MQTELVHHGIQDECSHLRVHVCFVVGRIYVFPTWAGRACLNHGLIADAYQSGITTGRGRKVPVGAIAECRCVDIPPHILGKHYVLNDMGESEKGQAAEAIVAEMFAENGCPLTAVSDVKLQRAGVDFVTRNGTRIQVKCDYKGGHKCFGGTGNLYLQTMECNPYRKH